MRYEYFFVEDSFKEYVFVWMSIAVVCLYFFSLLYSRDISSVSQSHYLVPGPQHFIVYGAHYPVNSVFGTVYFVHWTVHSLQC